MVGILSRAVVWSAFGDVCSNQRPTKCFPRAEVAFVSTRNGPIVKVRGISKSCRSYLGEGS